MRAEKISVLPASESSPFAWASCGPCGPCARQHGAPLVPVRRQEPNGSSRQHLLSVSFANNKRVGGVSEATRVPALALGPNTAPRAGPDISSPAQPRLRRLGSRELCSETQARVLAYSKPCTGTCTEPWISSCLVWKPDMGGVSLLILLRRSTSVCKAYKIFCTTDLRMA